MAADLSAEISNRIDDVDAEESRATSAEASLAADLSTEISNREDAVSAEESARVSGDASLAADLSAAESALASADASLSSEIDSLSEVDGATISLDAATNTIRLKESIAAPDSGQYTFASDVEVSGDLTVAGVNVMGAISSEISRAESAEDSLAVQLSTDVSYLISNTDLTAIDSFAEVSTELSTVVSDFEAIYFKKATFTGAINGTNDEFTLNEEVRAGSETVYLNGLLQEAGVEYTVAGSVVTFTTAPLAGDKVVIYGVFN